MMIRIKKGLDLPISGKPEQAVHAAKPVRHLGVLGVDHVDPEACLYCPDMTAEFADVSVGVLEGRPEMNTLIVRTGRGEEIVREARRLGYLELYDLSDENRGHLMGAAANKKKRAILQCRETGRLNGEEGKACLRLSEETVERILSQGKETSSCHS